jgi:hypothetical protein
MARATSAPSKRPSAVPVARATSASETRPTGADTADLVDFDIIVW